MLQRYDRDPCAAWPVTLHECGAAVLGGEQSAGELDEEGPFSLVANNLTFLGPFAEPDCANIVGMFQFACTNHNGQDTSSRWPIRYCRAPTFQDEFIAEMMGLMHPN